MYLRNRAVYPIIGKVLKERFVAEKVEKRARENRLQRYVRETVGELRKVTWPTRQEAWHLTKIVIAVMVVMAALLGTLDYIFSVMMTALLA